MVSSGKSIPWEGLCILFSSPANHLFITPKCGKPITFHLAWVLSPVLLLHRLTNLDSGERLASPVCFHLLVGARWHYRPVGTTEFIWAGASNSDWVCEGSSPLTESPPSACSPADEIALNMCCGSTQDMGFQDLVFPLIVSLGNNSKTKYGCHSKSTQRLKNTFMVKIQGSTRWKAQFPKPFIPEAIAISVCMYS